MTPSNVFPVPYDASRPMKVENPHLATLVTDHLYHIGLTVSPETKDEIKEQFKEIKYVIMCGTAERVLKLAHQASKRFEFLPNGYTVTSIGLTTRYSLYKVGPVLFANHGMGNPSISILLHELTKLLAYANAVGVVYLRVGTSGGLGVKPGTIVLTAEALNEALEPHERIYCLGQPIERPTLLSDVLNRELQKVCEKLQFPYEIGRTLCCNSFYEQQGRVDGAICQFTETEKLKFLQSCHDEKQVKNIEMESLAFASFCHALQIPAAVICVTLVNRLENDQITLKEEQQQQIEERPVMVVLEYIMQKEERHA